VDAAIGGRKIATDQPPESGGGGSAPEPFALFAASIGTCAGFYALTFCQSRGLETDGLAITERLLYGDARRIAGVELDVEPPRNFPEKYRDALVRAMEGCAVKKAIEAAPRFAIRVVTAAPREEAGAS